MIFLCSLKNTLFPFFTLFVVFSSNWINGKAVHILFRLVYISRLKYNERIILPFSLEAPEGIFPPF
ncbi:hypothetical protein A9239_09695 [Methanosarcina sp. A14]|nr:hypothetical protein A9239_09695 [Methanosarcina sp. A14]